MIDASKLKELADGMAEWTIKLKTIWIKEGCQVTQFYHVPEDMVRDTVVSACITRNVLGGPMVWYKLFRRDRLVYATTSCYDDKSILMTIDGIVNQIDRLSPKRKYKSRAKYERGNAITSLDELANQEFVFWNGKIYHRGWFMSWQFRQLADFVRDGRIFEAVEKEVNSGSERDGKDKEQQ